MDRFVEQSTENGGSSEKKKWSAWRVTVVISIQFPFTRVTRVRAERSSNRAPSAFRAFPPRLFYLRMRSCFGGGESPDGACKTTLLPSLSFRSDNHLSDNPSTHEPRFVSLSLSLSLFVFLIPFQGFLSRKDGLSYRENRKKKKKKKKKAEVSILAKEIKSTLVGLFHEIEVDNLNFDEED